MTKNELCKVMKLDKLGTYDCALPQGWLDAMAEKESYGNPQKRDIAYDTILSGTVWFYGPQDPIGYPFPLTPQAAAIIARNNT